MLCTQWPDYCLYRQCRLHKWSRKSILLLHMCQGHIGYILRRQLGRFVLRGIDGNVAHGIFRVLRYNMSLSLFDPTT
jgi:hypothetical protein